MKNVYLVLAWAFGIIFSVFGLITLVSSPLAGLMMIIGSLFLLPPIRNFFYTLTNISLSPKARSVAVFSLVIAFSIFLNQSLEIERQARIAQEEAERTQKAQKIRDENIAYFSANREQIISRAQTALLDEDYQSAIDACSKYIASGDSALIEINKSATDQLRAIKEAERLAKEQEEMQVRVNALLDRLKTVADTDAKQLRDVYQELTKYVPDNIEYQQKLASYSKKQAEIEAQEEKARQEQVAKADFKKSVSVFAEIETRYQENSKALGKYYATADQLKRGDADMFQLAFIITKYENANDKQAKALASKATTLQSKVAQQLRQMYASSVEEIFMKTGIDAKVTATGKEKRQLKLSYPLMSQPLVYKFQNEIKLENQARPFGFTSIVYTNGFDGSLGQTWTVDLSKI